MKLGPDIASDVQSGQCPLFGEFTFNEKVNDKTIVKNIILIFFILALNVINNYKTPVIKLALLNSTYVVLS